MCVQYVYSKLCELHIFAVCLQSCLFVWLLWASATCIQLRILSRVTGISVVSSVCTNYFFPPSFRHLSFLSPSLPPSFSPSPSLPPSPSLSLSLSLPLSFSQEVLRLIKEDKEAEASQLLRSDKELLHEACESGSVEAVNLLLDRGVTVSEWNKVSNYTCTQ